MPVIRAVILDIPIIYPVIVAMGFNPIWFGVLLVGVIEVGAITPPVGMNVFLLAGITDVLVGIIYKGVLPFVLADIIHVALLIAVPALCLILLDLMM